VKASVPSKTFPISVLISVVASVQDSTAPLASTPKAYSPALERVALLVVGLPT